MAEIAGARARLDRRGRELWERVADLASRAVRASVEIRPPAEPEVADWHEPVRHRHTLTVRAERPAGRTPDAVADAAAELLAAAGWPVARTTDGDAPVVTGTRDGGTIRVRVSRASGVVLITGETAAIALSEPDPASEPPPERTAATVDAGFVLCFECAGRGRCPVCGGSGWIAGGASGRQRCPECFGERVCPVCTGAGQLEFARLSPLDRARYRS